MFSLAFNIFSVCSTDQEGFQKAEAFPFKHTPSGYLKVQSNQVRRGSGFFLKKKQTIIAFYVFNKKQELFNFKKL